MVLRLALETSHSLPGGHQTLHVDITSTVLVLSLLIDITASPVVLRFSLLTSQPPWWYSDSPFIHRSLHGGTQISPIDFTASIVVLRLSLHTSQPPGWYSDSPYIHRSLHGGTQTLPIYRLRCLKEETEVGRSTMKAAVYIGRV